MFWKYNYAVSPQIELLLEKEDITLSELMDEEDILQECKAQNKKLIEFLLRPHVLEQLVTLIITEPDSALEENYRYRHSNTACEILTCDLPALNERLSADTTLLQTLYSFIKQEPPLNPLLCSFFSKTLAMLITRHNEQNWYSYQFSCLQVIEFLKSQTDCLSTLLKHMATPAIMDLLFKLISQVEGNDMRTTVIDWLMSENIVPCLANLFKPEHGADVHCNVSQLLCDVVRTDRDSLLDHPDTNCLLTALETPETIRLILENILSEPRTESSLVGGVQFLLVLFDQSGRSNSQFNNDNNMNNDKVCDSEHHNKLFEAFLPYLKDMHDVLLNPPQHSPIRTTVGFLEVPLGNARLQIARFICILLEDNYRTVFSDKLAELGIIDTLVDLFFKYTWNNFLHGYVEKTIANILLCNNGDVTKLQKRLFTDARIIQRMLEGWNNNISQQSQQNGVRKGYMGHLIKIVNNIDSVTSEPLKEFIRNILSIDAVVEGAWSELISGPLKTVNEKQNILLGGVHPVYAKNNDLSEDVKEGLPTICFGNFDDDNLDISLSNKLDVFMNGLSMSSSYPDSHDEDWHMSGDSNEFCLKTSDSPWDNIATKNLSNTLCSAFGNVQEQSEWADFSVDNFADFDSNFCQLDNPDSLIITADDSSEDASHIRAPDFSRSEITIPKEMNDIELSGEVKIKDSVDNQISDEKTIHDSEVAISDESIDSKITEIDSVKPSQNTEMLDDTPPAKKENQDITNVISEDKNVSEIPELQSTGENQSCVESNIIEESVSQVAEKVEENVEESYVTT
uniref:Putative sap family cell cycle dependent phosphatase-associated protein n=1 Tax=Xenopsylla cheopis TaxID=163159 RepID=A0A6M2DRT2_XENCH